MPKTNADLLASVPDVPTTSDSSPHADLLASIPDVDITANPKKEGVYQMAAPGVTDKTISIPYSNVMHASGAGWRIKPKDRETYAADRRAELLKGKPFALDDGWFTDKVTPAEESIRTMQLPEALPEKPGLVGRTVRSVEKSVQKVTEPTTKYPLQRRTPQASDWVSNPLDPATREMGANVVKRIGRVLFGIPDMAPQAFSALGDSFSHDPQKAADGFDRFTKMVNPTAQVVSRWRELKTDYHRDPKLAGANVVGDIAGLWLAGKAMEVPKGVVKLGSAAKEMAAPASKYAPGSVNIAGVDVPVGVGEEASFTPAGRDFIRLKRKGAGKKGEFESFERRQQQAIKNVIHRTAQQTSGLIGPVSEKGWFHSPKGEPAAAMKDAAEITFDRARPMYRALDAAVVDVPDTFAQASKITQTAIARAEKLGVVIDTEPLLDQAGNPVDRTQFSKADIDAKLKTGELHKETPVTHPLSTYMRVRSQLLKMQRLSKDPAVSYQIGQEIKTLNDAMDAALKGSPQAANWKEASRLWAKGYALRTVAREIGMITKGTPTEVQMQAFRKHVRAGEAAVIPEPTKLQGTSLVNRLNKLAENGVLEKAFTPEEAQNLRESANLLDRIQKTRVGRTAERTHGLGHVLGLGAKGSAALGAVAGLMHGGPLGALIGGVTGGAAMGGAGWVVELYENALAEVMTTTDGVQALRAVDAAKTPGQLQIAMKRLATLAAASVAAQQKTTKSPKELNEAAAQIAGAPPAAMPSQQPAPAAQSKPSAAHPVTGGGSSFARAISVKEGFGSPDAIPTQARNPGALELGDIGHGELTAANGQKITVFGSLQEGWKALDRQLNLALSGRDSKYPPSMTLEEFGKKYSGGDATYGATIAASLGVDPSTTLRQLAQGRTSVQQPKELLTVAKNLPSARSQAQVATDTGASAAQ